jgi:hypothetical protein
MFRFTKHAARREQDRGLNVLDTAVSLETTMKDKFGLDSLPNGEYEEGNTRLVVVNGKIVTATESHKKGHFRLD